MSDEGVFPRLPRTAVFALRSDPPLPTMRSGGDGARRPAHGAGLLIAGYLEETVQRSRGSAWDSHRVDRCNGGARASSPAAAVRAS